MTAPPSTLVRPAYRRASLADLLPSVLAASSVEGEADVLRLPESRRTVLLLVDGLGARLLQHHADQAPFLSSRPGTRELTTGFPATTVTSLASLGTGTEPGIHGMTGYASWVEQVDAPVNWLAWTSMDGDEDMRDRLAPEHVQPQPTIFERAAAAGVDVTVAGPARFARTGLTRAVLRGGTYRGAVTPGDAIATAVEASRRGTRSLVYCYTPDLDTTGHVRGVASEAWRVQLRLVDRFVEELSERLPADTTLLVTGDHGMVDVPEEARIDLDGHARLTEGVLAIAGEPRARHVHTQPGAADDVLANWTAELGDRMWVGRRADVVDAGLLGPTVRPTALARTGDVVAIATSDLALVRRTTEPLMAGLRGQHGALTCHEALVPLIIT